MSTNLASDFEITGPDGDGLLWLILHGNGTTGRAMFNLGKADRVAGQVALRLEEDRRAALAAPAQQPIPIAEVQVEPDYWSRGHFHEGRRKSPRVTGDLEHLAVGGEGLCRKPSPSVADRKPLTEQQAMDLWCKRPVCHQFVEAYMAGLRDGERAHGITAPDGVQGVGAA